MKGLIFDLDGVIVDTAKYHYKAWKRLADEIGVDFDEQKNEKLKGVNRKDSLIRLLGYEPEASQTEKWCAQKNSYYLEYLETINASDILPGAVSFLEAAHASGRFKTALASSSKNAMLVLEKLNLTKYFNAVVDGTNITQAKPHPEIFLTAASKIGTKPEESIVIEDAESGVEGAKRADMLCVGIGDPRYLKAADHVIKDLSQIDLDTVDMIFQYKNLKHQGA